MSRRCARARLRWTKSTPVCAELTWNVSGGPSNCRVCAVARPDQDNQLGTVATLPDRRSSKGLVAGTTFLFCCSINRFLVSRSAFVMSALPDERTLASSSEATFCVSCTALILALQVGYCGLHRCGVDGGPPKLGIEHLGHWHGYRDHNSTKQRPCAWCTKPMKKRCLGRQKSAPQKSGHD